MNKLISSLTLFILTFSINAEETSIKIDHSFRSFFTSYCTDCHNSKKQKGKVQLDDGFSFEIKTVQDADRWQKILSAINAGEMPPEDEAMPKESEKSDFLEMLSDTLVDARKFLADSGNETVMRRLNHQEYKNTIKDLLGVEVDASNLPSDHTSGGFNTDGGALFMSADQIEQHLTIAKKALNESFVTYADHKTIKKKIEPEIKTNKRIERLVHDREEKMMRAFQWRNSKDPNKTPKQFGFDSERGIKSIFIGQDRFYLPQLDYHMHPLKKIGALLSLDHPNPNQSIEFEKNNLPSGFYKIKAAVGRTTTATEERSFLDLGYLNDGSRDYSRIQTFHITAKYSKPQIIETTVYINDKNNKVVLAEKQTRENARSMLSRSRSQNGRSILGFSLLVDWIEWEGPLKIQGPEIIERILTEFKNKPSKADVRKIIKDFTAKAFRNDQASEEYIDKLCHLYEAKLKLYKKPLKAIIEPLSIVLASPGFLYMSEKSDSNKSTKLTQRELAIRLAYFLWSAQPDQELWDLVSAGKLNEDKTIKTQINRMMSDPKFDNFIHSFTYQWLHMERLNFFQFDLGKFNDFDETMKWAVAEELYQTVKYVTVSDLKTKNLLKSNFVVINALLANHYGIPNVKGEHFRKVKLPADSVRGGLTGMAAVHAMGSDGVHSSPVERGTWVLRKILNQPPPPAPANVPQLSEVGEGLTIRQMLKAHQKDAQCSHCHKKIDPIGFGLENFGPTGKWRTRDNRNKTSTKIDPSGAIYRGPKFKNYLELRDIFHSKKDDFNAGLTSHLLEYALGRKIGFSDQEQLKKIHTDMNKNGETIRS
ncbi:MAG: DUF1592 domain-containing protein, partial [Lentisphaeraceae bacterium]|nr:DUF1592 domain-containing protein [Lentisphaeraceae bacterium]